MTTDDDLGRALAESLTYVGSQARPPHGLVERLTEGDGARPRHRGGVRWAPLAAVAAVLALLALTGIVVLRHDSGPDALPATTGTSTSASRSAASLASARWTSLPDAPIQGRSRAVGVWTGSQLLVWGGLTVSNDPKTFSDGASYDPATRRWSALPAAPISGRGDAASVWTGKVLFVWGGRTGGSTSELTDGATYDPVTRTWHTLPPAPVTTHQQALALSVGGSVLLVTRTGNDARVLQLQAYSVATDSWTRLPDLLLPDAHPAQWVQAIAAGDRVLLWSMWAHPVPLNSNAVEMTSGIDGFTYDVAQRRWVSNRLGNPSVDAVEGPLWTGHDVVLPAAPAYCPPCQGPIPTGLSGLRLEPSTGATSAIPHGPVDDERPTYVWTGAALLAVESSTQIMGPGVSSQPGAAAVWDPTTGVWTQLPDAPWGGTDGVIVWTGHSLLVWGSFYRSQDSTSRTGGLELG